MIDHVLTETFEPDGGSYHLACGPLPTPADPEADPPVEEGPDLREHFDFPKRLYQGDDGAAELKLELLTCMKEAELRAEAAIAEPPPEPGAVRVVDVDAEIMGGKSLDEALAKAIEDRAARETAKGDG